MKKNKSEDAKNQSMLDKSKSSLDSVTGYKDRGIPTEVHFKARALRNGDNGSHH